jgi:hypothetical protein
MASTTPFTPPNALTPPNDPGALDYVTFNGLAVTPVATPATAGQVVAQVSSVNNTAIVNTIYEAIQGMQTLANQFTSLDIPYSLIPTDYWGNPLTGVDLADLFALNMHPTPQGSVLKSGIVALHEPIPEPSADGIVVPTIASAPVYTDTSQALISKYLVWDESLWDTSLLTAVQLKLLTDLANGGYGIEPLDELQLWNRAREREILGAETAIQEAARQAAARGFSAPPGAFFKQQQAAQQAALEKSSSVSRDIALKRADMYVENRKFTMQTAMELEKTLSDYLSAYYGRKLEAVKATLEAWLTSVKIYETQIAAFTATIRGQEQVAAVDVKVRAYSAKVSKYAAELSANVGMAQASVASDQANIAGQAAYIEGAYKKGDIQQKFAVGRSQIMLATIQSQLEAYKTQIGALEEAGKLYIAPAQALSSIANAYASQTSMLAVNTITP